MVCPSLGNFDFFRGDWTISCQGQVLRITYEKAPFHQKMAPSYCIAIKSAQECPPV